MKELGRNGFIYSKLEDPQEVDAFVVRSEYEDGFDFFRGLGIIGYSKTFKMWLRKFPRPIFIVAVDNREIISWAYVEEWEEVAKDGASVYVLRAIETLPRLRSKKIGYKLMLLILKQTTGYLLVKPLTPEGERFFKELGFQEEDEFTNPPIDLSKHSGYLILPPYKRKDLIKDSSKYFQATNHVSSS
jgi:GNAT superfamily N-acetyltransferase